MKEKFNDPQDTLAEEPFLESYKVKLLDNKERESYIEAGINDDKKKSVKKIAKQLKSIRGGMVDSTPFPDDCDTIMDEMEDKFPNFSPVINHLRKRLILQKHSNSPSINFGTPILLDGPAGIGKSAFLIALAKKFSLPFHSMSCASQTNGFDLTGLSGGFGTGTPGLIHKALVENACINPIIMLDEVEKGASASTDGSSIIDSLYELLEKNNAKIYKDEFVQLTMDASQIIWFATSNEADTLPSPIKDRFQVFKIASPTQQHKLAICENLYLNKIEEENLKPGVIDCTLDNEVAQILAKQSNNIRDMSKNMDQAFDSAVCRFDKQRKQARLLPTDVVSNDATEEWLPKIGFICKM